MLAIKTSRINRRLLRYGVLLVVLCWLHLVCGSHALATLLTAGSSTAAVAEPDPSGGILLAGGVPVPFAAATFSGTLMTEVIQGDLNNPWGPNALTFAYLLTDSATSVDELSRLTVHSFTGFQTDVSYLLGGVSPGLITRSNNGSVVGFNFNPGTMLPGSSSALLVIQTDATSFAPTFASVLGGSAVTVASFTPTVPEPSSFVLAIFGLGGLAAWCWRRRSR